MLAGLRKGPFFAYPVAVDTTPLSTLLAAQIKASGPLTVAQYMEACLYHPQHGYYTRGVNFLTTPPRDFLTAPEHTPLFGYTLANWVAKQWLQLGSPATFTLVEAGPGRGTLMRDILTHLHVENPACFAAAQPWLIEASPALTHLQQQTLETFPTCQWAATLASVPTNAPLLLIANEFLDAFPIHQYIHINDELLEIMVDHNPTHGFHFITCNNPATQKMPHNWQPEDGTFLETAPTEAPFLAELASRAAAALIIDYGAAALPTQGGNTLQAVHRHQPVGPFHLPGESDLTAHINFSSLISQLGAKNCQLTDLAPFLLQNGLPELGLQHPPQQPMLQRLLHPAEMGTLFKVLCFTPSTRCPTSPPVSLRPVNPCPTPATSSAPGQILMRRPAPPSARQPSASAPSRT